MKAADVLNILLPINQTFIKLAWEKFNPRNAMYISRNDGYFNNDVNHQRDTLINSNAMLQLSRDKYKAEDINNIKTLKNMSDEEFDMLPDFEGVA